MEFILICNGLQFCSFSYWSLETKNGLSTESVSWISGSVRKFFTLHVLMLKVLKMKINYIFVIFHVENIRIALS